MRQTKVVPWCCVLTIWLSIIAACGQADVSDTPGVTLEPTALATSTPTLDPATVTPTIEPTATPTQPLITLTSTVFPGPNDPFGLDVECDLASFEEIDFNGLASSYAIVVTGIVVEILPPEWTTSDGKRPENPWTTNNDETLIVRPMVLDLDLPVPSNNVDADVSSGQLIVGAWGGQIDQDSFWTNCGHQDFEVGERAMLALSHLRMYSDSQLHYNTSLGPAWKVGLKWRVADDGTALLDHFDAVPQPLDELLSVMLIADSDD